MSEPDFQKPEEIKDYKTMLAGGMSLHAFSKTNAFNTLLDQTKNELKDRGIHLLTITPKGVATAWITKLRFNEHMSDEVFFDFMRRADTIFTTPNTPLNTNDPHAESNDTIALMWGMQALASTEGYSSGAVKVRFKPGVAENIYNQVSEQGGRLRASTHAASTRIGEEGLGKDIIYESDRRFTPNGNGALLLHRTFQNNKDSSEHHAQPDKKTVNCTFDLMMKTEDIGYRDKLIHTFLHAIGPAKAAFMSIGNLSLFGKKSTLAKSIEKEVGTFGKNPRQDHLSAYGKEINNALFHIFAEVKKSTELQGQFSEFSQSWKLRMPEGRDLLIGLFTLDASKFSEPTIVGANGAKVSLGSFMQTLKDNAEKIKEISPTTATEMETIQPLMDTVLQDNTFAHCREGFEVLIDASQTGPAQLIPTA